MCMVVNIPQFNVHNVKDGSNSYLTGNSLCLRHKNQPGNSVSGKERSVLRKTQICHESKISKDTLAVRRYYSALGWQQVTFITRWKSQPVEDIESNKCTRGEGAWGSRSLAPLLNIGIRVAGMKIVPSRSSSRPPPPQSAGARWVALCLSI
jgi:hypothetical protein